MPQIILNKGFKSRLEIYGSSIRQNTIYRDIELSEKQIDEGQVKDAREALKEMGAKLSNQYQDRVDVAKSLFGALSNEMTLKETREEMSNTI